MKNKESIAITKDNEDYIRINPINSRSDKTEIKFSFLTPSFIIKSIEENKEDGLFRYLPKDCGIAKHEITYHNSNNYNPSAALLPKYRDPKALRKPISNQIIDLDLKNILVPIPICRITINKDSSVNFKEKEKHQIINLTQKYNTTEIFVSSSRYDEVEMRKRFPFIVGNLFYTTTIDFLIYGAGMASEPIIQKILDNEQPITSIESNIIGGLRFYYRTYEVQKSDKFRLTSNKIYSTENIIEFFNNVDYINLLGTTKIGFPIKETNKINSKPAYQWDMEHLKKIQFHNSYIKRWKRKFELAEYRLNSLNRFRSGIIYR